MRNIAVLVSAACLLAAGCAQDSASRLPTSPTVVSPAAVVAVSPGGQVAAQNLRNDRACWGEASAALAKLRQMGIHASQQDEPRMGLRNVARFLYGEGVLPDDSLQALGAFLASVLNMTIDSCM